MSDSFVNEPMLEMYIFETSQMLEHLEQAIMSSEKTGAYEQDAINEIFRFMHTIKGSSAMMLFNNIGTLAHSIEDIFFFLREKKPEKVNCSALCDLVFEAIDFIKIEIEKIKSGDTEASDSGYMIDHNKEFLAMLKQDNNISDDDVKPPSEKKQQYYIAPEKKPVQSLKKAYTAKVFFQEDCEMENVRAFTIVHNLSEFAEELVYNPSDILESDNSSEYIRENGFEIFFKSDSNYDTLKSFFEQTVFLRKLDLSLLDTPDKLIDLSDNQSKPPADNPVKMPVIERTICSDSQTASKDTSSQSVISVNVTKLDRLMDLVGEMVIAEEMVTHNPEVEKMNVDSFEKAARQLHKITSELQDMVMAVRMVPLSSTFLKMHRIVRDMCKKLNKDVELIVIGEETEVDKTIIERISDPLMHIIRNSIDHGIEDKCDRIAKGKDETGRVTLEAKNSGSDVLIIIKDDGKGLDKEKILKKARENDLIRKNESDMSDKEIFNLILLPGFSTKESVTEFSGRGVGMDVVVKNLESIEGSVNVDSVINKGTTITLKIPLTLAIIDGMNIQVGNARYTIPITAIKESFKPGEDECFVDSDNNEMIMVRGQCYPILRLHDFFKVDTSIKELNKGILIMVEQDGKMLCIFADKLLGKQQVVVKTLPNYIKSIKKIKGLSGCTILSDGSISLILDIIGLSNLRAM